MLSNVDDPAYWDKLALSFDAARKRLFELANDYDRIATRIHERAEKAQKCGSSSPPVPKRPIGMREPQME